MKTAMIEKLLEEARLVKCAVYEPKAFQGSLIYIVNDIFEPFHYIVFQSTYSTVE